MSNFYLKIIILVLCLFNYTLADLNRNRTFIEVTKSIPCIRRFNSTHQIGCGKLDKSNYDGVVYAIRQNSDFLRLNRLLTKNLIDRNLVIVTVPQMFTDVVEFYLLNQKNSPINGIVLIALKDNLNVSSFSDDSLSPNNNFGIYQNYSSIDWNSAGRSFMYQNFEIPFYVITEDSDASLAFEQCYDKYNKVVFERADSGGNNFKIYSTDSLCGMQLGIQYSGAVSTKGKKINAKQLLLKSVFNSFIFNLKVCARRKYI